MKLRRWCGWSGSRLTSSPNSHPNSGLHLVPIPFTKTFEDYYTAGEFESKDYPSLLAANEKIDTIAVPAVLSVFNWPKR